MLSKNKKVSRPEASRATEIRHENASVTILSEIDYTYKAAYDEAAGP